MSTHHDPRTAEHTVRASAVNRHHSLRRSAFVFGPTSTPPADTVTENLVTMAKAGPHTRIGLRPNLESGRWSYAPESLRHVVSTVADPVDDPLVLLDEVRGHEDDPIRVVLAGDYIAIDFDHGLGDAALLNSVADVILGVCDPADPATWQRFSSRIPALGIAAGALATDPRRLIGLARLLRPRAASTVPQPDPAPLSLVSDDPLPRPAALSHRIGAQCLDEVRAARDRVADGVGIYSLITVALVNALSEAGIALDEYVTAPFDARGYLPRGRSTLGNFSAGLMFPIPPGSSPAALQHAMTRSTRIGQPVANLALIELRSRLARTSQRPPSAPATRISLLHSSIGHIPGSQERFKWLDDDRAQVLAIADPPTISGVTITSAFVCGGICLGVAYHRKTIAQQTLQSAMDRVESHLRMLVGLPASR